MMGENEMPDVGPQQIDAVLRFLPIFQQPGYTFGKMHASKGQMPYVSLSDEVLAFHRALYEHQIVVVFDWTTWHEEAQQLQDDPQALAAADLLTVRKLLTAHVRADRFVEGHLKEVLENGHIVAVLRRLQAIRDQMAIKRNERGLPFLKGPLLDTIFDGVYEHDVDRIESAPVQDFLRVLYTMQDYNYRYRTQACASLLPLFEETVGPMEPNSEGTTMWLALGLAIVELYGMRRATLRDLLAQVTVRK